MVAILVAAANATEDPRLGSPRIKAKKAARTIVLVGLLRWGET